MQISNSVWDLHNSVKKMISSAHEKNKIMKVEDLNKAKIQVARLTKI